jgi:transcription elongation GreA/GreB family factor
MSEKDALFAYCEGFVQERLDRIRTRITAVEASLGSETKSSAGDKHETGRAMVQLEREKLGIQLAEAEKMQQLMAKVPKNSSSSTVSLGSLVKPNAQRYFLSISAGAYTQDAVTVYCVSPATPIGRGLLGKAVGESFVFNGKTIEILEMS